ncbi:MAG TPA: protein kinase, partial [Candidatus Nitrosotalea sp.]|nr:protein kinase [Candidatus Nitrosotalea sp.]
ATLARSSLTNAPLGHRVEQERWIRYYGPIGTIPGLSYHSAFDQAAGYFRGKTVFVGGKPLTPGVLDEPDEFPTPYTWKDAKYTPGVEIMATTFLNLLHGDWLSRLSTGWQLFLIVLAGCLFGFGLNLIRPLVGAGLGIVGMAAVTVFALWLFWHWNIWFSWVVIAGFQIPCAWICSVVAHTMRTELEKEELEEKLSTQRASQQSTVRAFDEPHPSRADCVANVPNHELIRCIGKGAFGEVWLAKNAIGTYHAAKIIYRNNFTSMESYAREFKGIQKYMPVSRAHPGLVQILHIGRDDASGYYFYVMECGDDEDTGADFNPETYSARNFAKDLRKRGKMPVADCVSMSLDLVNALGFLHGHGLIHRDIKPSNIIFVNGAPKLADIGLVTTIAVRGTETSQQGTPGYMAPDDDLRTPAADIYSLGKVIYEASTGHRVDQFPALPTWLAAGEQTAQLLELNPIILKCCEEDARRRYQSADELRADLLKWQRKFPNRKGSKGD